MIDPAKFNLTKKEKMNSENVVTSKNEWDLIIRPQRSWWDLRLGELWRYRDLIWLFGLARFCCLL